MLAGLAHPPYFSGANYFLILNTCVHVTTLMSTYIKGRGKVGRWKGGQLFIIVLGFFLSAKVVQK